MVARRTRPKLTLNQALSRKASMVKRRIKSINRRAVLEPQTTGTDDSRKQNARIYDEWTASGISDAVVG